MDSAAEGRADQDPECARKKTKLRRQHRSNERPRPSNCRKVMSEYHPPIRWHIIFIVILQNCRCGTLFIQHEHLCRQPAAIKTVADRQSAESGNDYPERA